MKKLNYMKSSTAVMIVVLLLTACLWDSWQVRLAEVAAMQTDGVARLQAMIDPELYRKAEQKEISKSEFRGGHTVNAGKGIWKRT